MGFQVAFESENVSAQSNVSSIQVDGASTENNATGQFGVYAILRMIIDNKLQIINRKLLVPTELPSQTSGLFSRFVVLIGFMPFINFLNISIAELHRALSVTCRYWVKAKEHRLCGFHYWAAQGLVFETKFYTIVIRDTTLAKSSNETKAGKIQRTQQISKHFIPTLENRARYDLDYYLYNR